MAVNAELYLRSSNARLRAPTSDRDAAFPFGFVVSTDGLPLAVSDITAEPSPAPSLAVVPSLTPAAVWQGLLPELERQLGTELRAFRRRMLAGRIPPDYLSDLFPGRRSGAWAIYRDIRTIDGQDDVEFCLYVRRGKDQLAVWEGPGTPDALRANFSNAVPGRPPVADDVRRGLAAALVRHRIATHR